MIRCTHECSICLRLFLRVKPSEALVRQMFCFRWRSFKPTEVFHHVQVLRLAVSPLCIYYLCLYVLCNTQDFRQAYSVFSKPACCWIWIMIQSSAVSRCSHPSSGRPARPAGLWVSIVWEMIKNDVLQPTVGYFLFGLCYAPGCCCGTHS